VSESSGGSGVGLVRALCVLVFALMIAAMAYASWIALVNWSHIGV
jgi:hypothetical protein